MTPGKNPPTQRPAGLLTGVGRESRRLARDLIPVVVVALVVCQVIRSHLLEWYLVPSTSMEPTLHGDPRTGDLVLVDKTAYWSHRPERFDLVVLRNRDATGHGHLVKRVVAYGDDPDNRVRIAEGDLFAGGTRGDLRRVVKSPERARSMRLTNFVFPEVGRERVTEYFRPTESWRVRRDLAPSLELVTGGHRPTDLVALLRADARAARRARDDLYVPGHLSTRVPVNTTFLGHDGEPQGSCELYRDIGMELEFTPSESCTGVQLVFEYYDRYYAFEYARDGTVGFTVMGLPRTTPGAGPIGSAPPLGGRALALGFGYLDGWFFLEVDGRLVAHFEQALPFDPPANRPHGGNHNLLHVGIAGGPVRVRRLRIFHDVYYRALGGIYTPPEYLVEPGAMFLLGDNTFDSKDSRMEKQFRTDDLVGRPLSVIGPVSRMRWLTR